MIKMIFIYSFKHKLNVIATTFFMLLSILIFNALMMISSNLQNSYNHLVNNGNLNNGVVYELYSTTVKEDDPTTPDVDETTLTGDEAKLINKKLFRQELTNFIGPENQFWRDFYSIDYNATNSGYVYKVVETDLEYTINKVVMYEGNNSPKLEYDFANIITQANWNRTDATAADARKLLLSIITRAKFSDGSNSSGYGAGFKKLLEYCGNNDPKQVIESPTFPRNLKKYGDLFNKWLITPGQPGYQELRDKIYRLSFSIPDGTAPAAFNFDNFSSYSLVVPTYVLENHNKSILPQKDYDYYLSTFCNPQSLATQSDFEIWIKTIPEQYKIQIDNQQLLIVGAGISPDFMYPVYDFAHITPNVKTEILSYGNIGAYSLVQDANRSSPTDNYIVFKVDNLNNKMLDELNMIARKYMAWPENINAVYLSNDNTNIFSPIGLRVNFLPQLINMQISLSNILSFFIAILTCCIFIFTVQKFIYDNRSSLAVLRANGFKKRWIIFMLPMFAIFPSVVGWMFGYTIAQLTQGSLLGLYSSYWVIPTAISPINPLLFVFTLIVPFLVLSFLAIIFSYLTLRKNTKDLLSESSRFKINPLAKWASSSLLAKASVITKFKAGISFSSLPKLTAITMLFTLLSIVSSFSVSLVGKFNYIKSATFDTKKYNFAIDFITPTIQGGGYLTQTFKDAGKPVINNKNEVVSFNGAAVDPLYTSVRGQTGKQFNYYNVDQNQFSINPGITENLINSDQNGHITNAGSISFNHIPSFNDSSWQAGQITYLRHRMETPLFVDTTIGLGTNPFDIARALMPHNSVIQANKMSSAFWTTTLNDSNKYFTNENIEQYRSSFKKVADFEKFKTNVVNNTLWDIMVNKYGYLTYINESDPEFNTLSDNNKIYNGNNQLIQTGWYKIDRKKFQQVTAMTPEFVIIMSNLINQPLYIDNVYKILYNIAIFEPDEESYTKSLVNYAINNESINIPLIGIKPDSKFIDLINESKEDVKYKLKLNNDVEAKYASNIHEIYNLINEASIFGDSSNYKLIINKSAAYQYNLSIGSKIVVDPIDEATRFNPKNDTTNQNVIDLSQFNNKQFTLEVVDIIETYQNPEFYVNQRIANYMNNMHLEPILEQSFYTTYNYDEFLGLDTSYTTLAIDPWNGLFSKNDFNKNVSVNQVLYSPSGLAPPVDTFTLNDMNYELVETAIKAKREWLTNRQAQSKQEFYIAKMYIAKALGYIDQNTLEVTPQTMDKFEQDYPANQYTVAMATEIINKLLLTYGNSPFLSSANNITSKTMFTQIFDNTSSFVNSILILVLIIVSIISALSIIMLSIDFISSSIALCAILKSLGMHDKTNAFNFLSMFFPAGLLGIIISIPLSILFNDFVMKFLYGFSNILLPISYQWWLFLIAGLIIGSIIAITIGISIYVLKRQNLTKTISGF